MSSGLIIAKSYEAIRLMHETITLPGDLLLGKVPEHPTAMRVLWSIFTAMLAALFVIVMLLPVPNLRAQRNGPARDRGDGMEMSERLTTAEQKLMFANERIRELQLELDTSRKAIEELKSAMRVMETTLVWMQRIAGSVLAAFGVTGGLIARKIWRVGK